MVEDSKFNNTVLTNIGHQMLTSISSGNKKITYTKAEAYTQDVSSISNETLQALTSLQGKQLSANLLVSNGNGNVVTITANFRNKGLTNDVVFNSIGWFAMLDTDDAEHGITANQEYLIGITPANSTQTLVAPPADQSSSQAISINLNMTLSDASNVNMTVSDAGAVHFNQLDDQLAKYTTTADLTKLLAGKADLGLSYTKAEIDAKLLDLTTDTDGKVSADQVQALIADKANISDVYTKSQVDSALSTRDAQISTKANISDVYTKSDVDSALSTRDTQISTKANTSDVYTKSDVDNALATDRGRLGKLEGIQTLDSPDFNSITSTGVYYITDLINGKNSPTGAWGVLVVSSGNGQRISQVYYPDDGSPQWCRLLNGSNWLPWYQLSTKKDVSNAVSQANKAQDTANQANTKAQNALDNKADKTTVEEGLATKANASDLSALQNSAMQVIYGNSGDDILSFRDEKIRCYNKAQNVQNLPDMSNKTWFYVITYTKKDWGSVTVISQNNCYWQNTLNANMWSGWVKHATSVDITNLQSQINSKTSGTVVTGYDIAGKKPTTVTNSYTSEELVDQGVLGQFADQINQLKGRQTVDSPNFNTLTDSGIYHVTNPDKGENFPTNRWGVLVVFNGNNQRATQLYVDDNGTDAYVRIYGNGDNDIWSSWTQIAWKSDISDLQNAVNNKVNVTGPLYRRIQYSNTWKDIFGVDNNNALTSLRIDPNGSGALLNNNAAGIGFGGDDTKGVLSVDYGNHLARITGGNGSGPVWSEDIAWKSDVNDLRNQIRQLKDNQFEVQTFTDATAAANWEAQRPGKRMAIVNS